MIFVREIVRILGNGGNRESAAEIGRGMRLRLGWPFIQVKETRFINPEQSAMRGTVVASRSFRLFLSFVLIEEKISSKQATGLTDWKNWRLLLQKLKNC